MITFSKTYPGGFYSFVSYPSGNTQHITLIETKGNDLDDMMANATIEVESDWGGMVECDFGELPQKEFDEICEMFAERLRDEADARAEAMSDISEGE